MVIVEDTGNGIEEQDLPRIFERFVRGGAGRRSGTGLGLSIVRAIVDAHGGFVGVSSKVGSGTLFRLELPRFTSFERAHVDDGPMTIGPASSEAAAV